MQLYTAGHCIKGNKNKIKIYTFYSVVYMIYTHNRVKNGKISSQKTYRISISGYQHIAAHGISFFYYLINNKNSMHEN